MYFFHKHSHHFMKYYYITRLWNCKDTEASESLCNIYYFIICMLIFAGGLLTAAPVVCWHAEIAQTLADYNATLRDVIPLDIDLFLLIMSASLNANVSPVLTVTVPYNGWCSKIAQNEPRRVTTATAELYEMEKLSYRCTRSTSTFEKHLVETITADWTVLQQCSGHGQRMDKVYW